MNKSFEQEMNKQAGVQAKILASAIPEVILPEFHSAAKSFSGVRNLIAKKLKMSEDSVADAVLNRTAKEEEIQRLGSNFTGNPGLMDASMSGYRILNKLYPSKK
jgi:hypothetical protein